MNRDKPTRLAPHPRNRTAATIKEVAAEAGASIASVSHVLNNTRPVSPELRARVLDAARRLNFHPSASARGLRMGHGPLIELLLPDLGPACARIAEAAAAEAAACGGRVAVTASGRAEPGAREITPGPRAAFREPPTPVFPDWRPLPADVVVDLGASTPEPGRCSSGVRVGSAPRLSLLWSREPDQTAPVDVYGAVRRVAARMLAQGHPPILLWNTGEPGLFGAAEVAAAAERAIAACARDAGYGRSAAASIVSDPEHLEAAAKGLVSHRHGRGVIVNGVCAASVLRRIAPDLFHRSALLDRTGCSPGTGPGFAVDWDWSMAGRALVRAALALACGQEPPPLRVPYRLRAG